MTGKRRGLDTDLDLLTSEHATSIKGAVGLGGEDEAQNLVLIYRI